MNAASIARFLAYALGFAASILALKGYATYENGQLDILPFDVSVAATWIVTAFTNGLAMLAVVRGWGKK